jgi:ADP-ribose pyrophosphatase YjhB (NUDIX family)
MERHFTVTGFVVEGGRTLLHWHPKLSIWLPPGGHVDPDEDPVQAVLREVLEETGITAEIVAHQPPYAFENVAQLPPPFSIIVADVGSGDEMHQHIDFAYVVRPVAGVEIAEPECDHGFIWVGESDLRRDDGLRVPSTGEIMPITDDVREVGLAALELVRRS